MLPGWAEYPVPSSTPRTRRMWTENHCRSRSLRRDRIGRTDVQKIDNRTGSDGRACHYFRPFTAVVDCHDHETMTRRCSDKLTGDVQGPAGNRTGWRGPGVGFFDLPDTTHGAQSRTKRSKSESRSGHQIAARHLDFMRLMPGCPSWASSRSCRRSEVGMMTQLPRRRQRPTPATDSSACTLK